MSEPINRKDKIVTLFINSSTITNKNALGSQLTIYLNEPISLTNKRIRLISSDIWYVFPNIKASNSNNTMKFVYNAIAYTMTLNDGLYSLSDISETLNEYLIIQGLDATLTLKLVDDESTSLITFSVTNVNAFSLDCNDVANKLFKDLLGFTGVLADAGGGGTTLFESNNRAALNVVDQINVHVSFAGLNNFENGVSGSTLVKILPLNGAVGQLMHYEPLSIHFVDCVSMECRNFLIELRDQHNNLLDMQGEPFNLAFEIV